MPRRGRAGLIAAGLVAAAVLNACTSGRAEPGGTTTRTQTQTLTRSAPPAAAFTPPAPSTRRPLAPGVRPHPGERAGPCPYIKAGLDVTSGSGANVADLEGDRIGRTTVLSALRPVGCRFYFANPGYEAVAEIRPQTLPDATSARNAMVRTARTGRDLITERGFVPGVDGICFRTRFFGPDGARDWAFVFAEGRVLVIVYTQVTVSSRNALYLARAIAGHIPG